MDKSKKQKHVDEEEYENSTLSYEELEKIDKLERYDFDDTNAYDSSWDSYGYEEEY